MGDAKVAEAARALPSEVAFVLENLYESLRGIIGAETRGLIVAELGQVVDAFTEALASAEQRAREARGEGYREGWEAKDIDTERRERESFERGVAAERAAVVSQAREIHSHAWGHWNLYTFADWIEKGSHHEDHSDAIDRVREQVRAETLAACLDALQRNAESEAYAGGDGEPYLIAKSALRAADIPGADALARREAAAYERGREDERSGR